MTAIIAVLPFHQVSSTLHQGLIPIACGSLEVMKPVTPEWHNEDQIETVTRIWLTSHGWQVQHRQGQSGADISAVDRNNTQWLFEVKGYPATYKKLDGVTKSESSKRAQRRTWFIEALGQIVSRINEPDLRVGIVFPDHPTDKYFQTATQSLPQFLREKLRLWVFLIDQTGAARVLRPNGTHFEDTAHAKLFEA